MSLSDAYDLIVKTEGLLAKKNKDLVKIRENYVEIVNIFKETLSKNLDNKEIHNALDLVINEYTTKLREIEELINDDGNYSIPVPNVNDLNTKRGIPSDPLMKFQLSLLKSVDLSNKDKELIQTQLNQLKKEIHQREVDMKTQYELKIKSLTLDNKNLKLEITRLNKRWNELVESAKKRRNSNTNNTGTAGTSAGTTTTTNNPGSNAS